MNNQDFNNKHIIIIHGYTASPQSHWFPWLKKYLENQGAVVTIPAMPNSSDPDPVEWLQYLEQLSLPLDANTILIGHSLGCITGLRFLEKHRKEIDQIGGYILVSGFAETLETIPSLKGFTDYQLDDDALISITEHRASMISSNDEIVKPEYSVKLANRLQIQKLYVENAGHFLDRDGYTELADIFPVLEQMIE